jgi:TP901 family phage tail tape measure protein
LVRASGDTAGAEGALMSLSNRADKAGKKMQRTGAMLTRRLTLPLLALGGAALKSYADFDGAMTNSLSIMQGVTGKQRDMMERTAREIGRTTTISATQAAEAYYFLASAGLDAEQSIAALPQVAKFAQAGNFDMAKATDLATDAQSALGLASKDAAKNLANMTRVTDVVARASQNANASMEEFSTALTNKAGASMKVFGIDMEEGVAALQVFADKGVKGEKAGTMFTATLNGLSKAATANADKFAELGIEVFDAEGNIRNLADVSDSLTDAFGPMTDAQRATALAQLGINKLTADGVNNLMGAGDAMREYEAANRSAGGAVEEVAAKQLESFNAKMALLKNNLLDAGIAIGEKLAPHVEKLAEKVQRASEAIQGASDGQVKWAIRLGMLAAAAGPAIWAVGTLLRVAGGILKVAAITAKGVNMMVAGYRLLTWNAAAAGKSKLAFAAASVKAWVIAGAAALKGAAKVAIAWIIALGPIGLAIAAIGVAVVLVIKYWDQIKAAILAAGAFVVGWLRDNWKLALVALIGGPIVLAGIVVKKNWDRIKKFTQAAAKAVLNWLKRNWRTLLAILTGPIGIAVALIRKHWSSIRSHAATAWSAIRSVVVGAARGLVNGAMSVIGGIVSRVRNAWSSVRSGASSMWSSIRDTVTGAARGIVDSVVSFFTSLPGRLASAGASAGTSFANAIKGAVNAVLGRIRGFALPTIEIAGKRVPGSGSRPFSGIPSLAQGGLAFGPTLAMVGDHANRSRANPEVIAPLDKLVDVLRMSGAGGSGNTFYVTGYDPQEISTVIARKQRMMRGAVSY